MPRCVLFLLTAFCFGLSCNNNTGDASGILNSPPFAPLTDSIARTPNNPDLYYRRGSLLYSNQNMDEAERDLRSAWQLDHKEQYALSLTTVLKQKNTDSAVLFLKQAVRALPNSLALKIGLARGYQQKNQLESAKDICNQVLKVYPNQIDALELLSELFKAQNKTGESVAALEKAFALAPQDKELAYNLDYEYASLKDPRAITLADYLIKKDSTETVAKAYYVKATYFKNVGQTTKALLNYNTAIANDYNFLDAYLDKGQLLFSLAKYSDAESAFRIALKISPTTADFYYWLGKTQEAQHNKEEARLNYQRAYGLDKSFTEARDAAARL